MNSYDPTDHHEPLMWIRGYPIYAAHGVVLAYVLSMIATTIVMATGAPGSLNALTFASDRVLHGEAWRVLSYGLVNPPGVWFAVDMVMIAWFGREVEKVFGRAKFLSFYAGLYLLPPLALTAIGPWQTTALAGRTGAFALFIAFATLYPNVAFFLNILAKWAAIILVAIYTLMALSERNLAAFVSLATTVGFAFLFVRHQQGRISLPSFATTSNAPPPDPRPRVTPRPTSGAVLSPAAMAEVDALLDKIATSGIHSLTSQERARLDAARTEMVKRGKSR